MAKSTSTSQGNLAAEGSDAEVKTLFEPLTVEVTSANSFAEVLDYDQKGYRVLFACEKGQLLALTDDEIEQLSKFTRTVYQAMKAQNASMEAEDPAWDEIKKKFKVGDVRGSARARMAVSGIPAGMETRYFRPDNTGTAEAKGWRPAKPSTYKVSGGHDGHVSIKTHGEDELVLFERPKSFRVENDKRRREQKEAKAAAERHEYEETAARNGYRALEEAEVASGAYREIE